MDLRIITNNPLAADKCKDRFPVLYQEVSYEEILLAARDLIHQGCRLLTHPLSGSVKPGETPYKSLAVTLRKGPADTESVTVIEESLACCRRFGPCPDYGDGKLYADFRLIDLTLLESGLPE